MNEVAPSLRSHTWEPRYATGRDDLLGTFYEPALEAAVVYDRATGFFRSSFYDLTRSAVAQFALRDGRIRLVCSPELTPQDVDAIERGQAASETVAEEALRRELARVLEHPHASTGADVLAALLACGALEIRIAVPMAGRGVFHDKFGVFEDAGGDLVSFAGSVNETWAGWHPLGNHESFEVFTSWGDEARRPQDHHAMFERVWASRQPGLVVREPSGEVLDLLRRNARDDPQEMLRRHVAIRMPSGTSRALMDHQSAALEAWRRARRRGVLKHATGSGKTVTALAAIREHIGDGRPALVLVPSLLLLEQWDREVQAELASLDPAVLLASGQHPDWRARVRAFTVPDGEPRVTIAMMATARTSAFRSRIAQGRHLLVVADEVHRLGAVGLSGVLALESGAALGLSATPERAGDPAGTARIFAYFGPIVRPEFTLADAIAAGRLCPYEYHLHVVTLTADEQHEWRELSRDIRLRAGRAAGDDAALELDEGLKLLLIRRARVARGATNKAAIAAQIVADNYSADQRWLVYCDDTAQLDTVHAELEQHQCSSMPYHSAMASDRDATLDRFTRDGGVLVAIKCLDEGVDIPAVSHAVIVASSKNPREFIQRRGRVLRTHPGKYAAVVHDLVVTPPDDDAEDAFRSLALGELARAHEFASSALNVSARIDLHRLAIEWGIDPGVVATTGVEDDED